VLDGGWGERIFNKGSSFRFKGLWVGWKELLSNLQRKVLLHCYEENMRSFNGSSVKLVNMVWLLVKES